MKNRAAFTMIELIFVIAVMGIIGKFGVEFLAQAYKSFIFSNINNSLLSKSASTVEFIGSRLQYRIKDSVIARVGLNGLVTGVGSASGTGFTVLEWVSMDIDGYRSTTAPNWSGIADLDPGQVLGSIVSPRTDTTAVSALINTLSYKTKSVNNAALYFVGSNSDVQTGYGWNGALIDQTETMHPIRSLLIDNTQFLANTVANPFFTGVDIYEYYKLAWTAYAIEHNANGDLILHYDYQPWNGDSIANGDSRTSIIMEDVSTFQFTAIGEIIKIQVCTKSDIIDGDNDAGGYSLCKEKTIF